MSKNVNCKNCGAQVDSGAMVCPKCGVKIKKPIYKKPWFIILAVIVIIAIIAGTGDNDEKPEVADNKDTQAVIENTPEEIIYEEVSVSKMVDDLKENALKAENTYDGKNLKITGKVSVIDSDGDYISLEPSDNPYTFTNVSCYIKNEEQLNMVMEIAKGQKLTVYGEITSVGEILGYSMDIHKIEF